MRKNVRLYSLSMLASVLLLMLSNHSEGILGDVLLCFAILIPLVVCELHAMREHREREEERGMAIDYRSYFGIKKDKALLFLPTVIPTVAAIAAVSYLTVLLMGAFGYSSDVSLEGSLPVLLVTYALSTAVVEELLFRYLPMRLFGHHSPRGAVVISALLFGFYHLDLFKIPYAILAGVIFMTVDLMADSVIPSTVIHFVNNAISITMIKYSDNNGVMTAVYISLGVLLLLSLALIVRKRRNYVRELRAALAEGDDNTYCPSVLALPLVSLIYSTVILIN